MAFPTFPLTLPTTTGITRSNFNLQRVVGMSQSPFTGQQQVYEHSFALWSSTITLAPMKRATASEYQTFFMQLHGMRGTFLMGDPDAKTKRGNATQSSLTIASNTAVGAYDIPVSGLTNSQSSALVKGDYIQFGTGSSSKLHMIVANVDASASGTATIQIEPALKVAITTSTSCSINNCVGVWRLDTNEIGWDADRASTYGFSFSCSEAI